MAGRGGRQVPAHHQQARVDQSGQQLADPARAARAMLAIMAADQPPAHLLLGSDALRLVRAKLDSLAGQFDAWETLTGSTDG